MTSMFVQTEPFARPALTPQIAKLILELRQAEIDYEAANRAFNEAVDAYRAGGYNRYSPEGHQYALADVQLGVSGQMLRAVRRELSAAVAAQYAALSDEALKRLGG